jgi:opacity protein-like surface antigen
MKTILLSLTAAAALAAAAAAPAAAQPWRDHDSYSGGYANRGPDGMSQIRAQEWQIRSAVRDGRISGGQARQLFDELRSLRPAAWRLDNGRWNNSDYQELSRGLGHVQASLNVYASGRDDRYADRDGYGRDWRR